MSMEENKALVRRFIEEAWNEGNAAVVDELCAPNFVFHPTPGGISPDREGYKQWVSMTDAAYPDGRITVEDVVAEGDRVVARWSWRGTHQGEIWGIAPTGKQVATMGITIDRIEGNRIVEEWIGMDMLSMMQQLGVMPSGQGKG